LLSCGDEVLRALDELNPNLGLVENDRRQLNFVLLSGLKLFDHVSEFNIRVELDL